MPCQALPQEVPVPPLDPPLKRVYNRLWLRPLSRGERIPPSREETE